MKGAWARSNRPDGGKSGQCVNFCRAVLLILMLAYRRRTIGLDLNRGLEFTVVTLNAGSRARDCSLCITTERTFLKYRDYLVLAATKLLPLQLLRFP